MPTQMIFPLVMMALFGAYAIWMQKKRRAGVGPGLKVFLERTGYRYAELSPTATMDEQIAYGAQLAGGQRGQMQGGGYQTHMVRDFHGLPVHWKSWTKVRNDGGYSMGCNWTVEVRSSAKIQIAEKSLSGAGKAIKEVFSNSERAWEPAYPNKVSSGDAELDKRFQIYAEDPAAARVLAAPGVRELLLGCVEVDLIVARDEVRFADPFQKNMRAGMGGTLGQMALAGNLEKMMEVSTPVHDRIAELLATVARAAA